jgi:hypothetical protein
MVRTRGSRFDHIKRLNAKINLANEGFNQEKATDLVTN